MYKAIFLDMDGTLLNSQKEISSYTSKILHKLVENNIKLILISGRCNKSMEYIAKNRINKDYELIQYIISTDGTMIKDLKNDKIIYQNNIEPNIVKKLIDASYNLDTAFYILTETNMYKDNRITKSQQDIDNWYINGEFFNIENNLTTIDFRQFKNQNEKVNRILFFSNDIKQLEKINNNILEDSSMQTLYKKDYKNYQLLLASKKYSKAMGVIHICKYLNIPVSQTIAFGDSDNDIEMLNIVGKGIAMKNASIDLNINEITKYTNNEDGVAKYLEDMMNNSEI